jgi:hypothetical protein
MVETTIKNCGVEVTFNSMTSSLNFTENTPIGSKGIGRTDRQEGDLISLLFPLGRKIR